MELVFEDVSRFDVIHFHCDYLHFPLLRRCPCRSVTTIHGRMHAPDLAGLLEANPDVPLVSISDDQRRPMPHANWQSTVYHGLPTRPAHFPPPDQSRLSGVPGDRISPEKTLGPGHRNCTAVQGGRSRWRQKFYPEEREYYSQVIARCCEKSRSFVEFVGEVGGREKDEFLGNASALLFPSIGLNHSGW